MLSVSGDVACEDGLHGDEKLVCLSTLIAEDFFAEVADRSEFISAQLDCIGEGGDVGDVKVPAGAGKLWVRCLLRAPAALHASDDSTLVQFLKAAAFFHDESTVKKLIGILGTRLHDAACSEQPACSKTEHMTLVLEALPVDLAMEVLRSMPGSFLSNFSHLPPALQPIAALADYPALAAAFMPPVEGLHTDAALPTVMLCVDINPDAVATAPGPSDTTMHGTETSQDMANQEIWLDSNQEVDGQSLFFLNKRAGTVACHLLARSTKLHVLKIKLPDNVCIVFGAGTLHLKNVTFEGGSVVCMGSRCCPILHDCTFRSCSLIVLAGARATLATPQFQDMDACTNSLSVCADGAGSCVFIRGGSIIGGVQGVAVQAGARLEASDFTITRVGMIGLEVKDEKSSVALTGCSISAIEMDQVIEECRGVRVQSSSSAHLSDVSISEFSEGVGVHGHASATLVDCKLTGCDHSCVNVCGGSTGRLDRCTISDGRCFGIEASGAGSQVHATHCHIFDNGGSGLSAYRHGSINAVSCTSRRNGLEYECSNAGYEASKQGVVQLSECTSDGDYNGCLVDGGNLVAHKVNVTRSETDGFVVGGGHAELIECSSKGCRGSGMFVHGDQSQLDVEGFCSSGNEEGYMACDGAQLTVSRSSSVGDGGGGYGVRKGGKLTMVEVTVDGVCKSCEVP